MSSAPAIPGASWLACHNPQINWSTSSLMEWSVACHSRCLHSTLQPAPPSPHSAPVPINLSAVPEVYHDLRKVFSKLSALALLPYHPYDCTIHLWIGVPLPSIQLYNLSKPEQKEMERYISEPLAAGLIRPSCSSVDTGFFFLLRRGMIHFDYSLSGAE